MADVFPSTPSEIYQDPKFLAELKVFKALQAHSLKTQKFTASVIFLKRV